MICKKLIYYFYLTEDFEENRGNKINFACLSRYAHIFDSVDIYISTDDTSRYDLIRRAEAKFVSLPFKGDLSFRIVKNGPYMESAVIKSEILDKLGSLDSLVFFAHAKGYSSLEKYQGNIDDIERWITGCYYLSLEYINEMEETIGDTSKYLSMAFGSFPIVSPKKIEDNDEGMGTWNYRFPGRIKYNWFYSGTFFWINTNKLYNYINIYSPAIPKVEDRYFGERMLGNIFPYDRNATGHNSRFLYPCNFYNEGVATSNIEFILEEGELEHFNKFHNEIISNI